MGWINEMRVARGLAGVVRTRSSSGSEASNVTQERSARDPGNEDGGWDTASASDFASQAQCEKCEEWVRPEVLPPGLGVYMVEVRGVETCVGEEGYVDLSAVSVRGAGCDQGRQDGTGRALGSATEGSVGPEEEWFWSREVDGGQQRVEDGFEAFAEGGVERRCASGGHAECLGRSSGRGGCCGPRRGL